MNRHVVLLALSLAGAGPAPLAAQALFDRPDQALVAQSATGAVRSEFTFVVDLEAYRFERPAPGLVFAGGQGAINPRLTLFNDTQFGKHVYAFVQARVDRGFDPLEARLGVRIDEYLIRYTPSPGGQFNVQVGKFATVVGAWVQRHHSWDSALINAPIPYENVTTITDHAAPVTIAAFVARRAVADKKREWLPVIWGPAYTTGASIFGSLGRLDYAIELKNRPLAARPESWSPTAVGWKQPSVGARMGYRPGTAWNLGLSFSRGAYLLNDAINSLPTGRSLGSYRQSTFGTDISYARRHWQVWGEVVTSRFDVPNAGSVDTWAYFVEAKYKATPQMFVAGRFGQQFFGEIPDGLGGLAPWDGALWRAETSVGYRFTRHFQAKMQYSFGREDRQLAQGRHLLGVQLTAKF